LASEADFLNDACAADQRRLDALKGQLANHARIAEQATGIMAGFDARLSTLERTLKPVHKKASKLRLVQDNIDAGLESLNTVLNVFGTARDVEQTLRDGFSGDIDQYLASVDRCAEAIQYLKEHREYKSAPKMLENLEALLARGVNEISEIVKRGFGNFPETLDPAKLSKPIVLMKQERIVELQRWIERLTAFGRDDYLRDYVDKRGKFLAEFLKKLIKLNRYDKDAKTIALLDVVLDVLDAEKDLAREVLGARKYSETFGELLTPGIEFLLETMQNKIDIAKSSGKGDKASKADAAGGGITQQFGIGLFVLLDLWEAFSAKVDDLNRFVKLGKVSLATHMADFVKNITAATRAELRSFITALNGSGGAKKDTAIPDDATVHSLTSNTLNYLKRLHESYDVVHELIAGDPQLADTKSKGNVVGSFYVRVLDALKENLETKARRKEKKGEALSTIFLLNNYNYVLKHVQASGIKASVEAVAPRFAQQYQELIEARLAAYRDSWQRAVDCVLSPDLPSASGNYSKKERGAIKDAFATFNAEVDLLSSLHRAYFVPDEKMRKKVRTSTKANVVPPYVKFYNEYSKTPFTENLNKYLKYTPEAIEALIDGLFEGAAKAKSGLFAALRSNANN
jgi:exocyst complex protein 7